MTRLDFSWKDHEKKYWHYDDRGVSVVNDDAPKEIKEAYERYLKQVEAARKRGTI